MSVKLVRLVGMSVLMVAAAAIPATAAGPTPVAKDPYSGTPGQHATLVESDTFAHGSTIVAGYMAGRNFGGGADGVGFVTSHDRGATWESGILPRVTSYPSGGVPTGPWAIAGDPSVAYDPVSEVWMIAYLVADGIDTAVLVSRSKDGVSWSDPVTVDRPGGLVHDKPWIACDPGSSAFAGHCYVAWVDLSEPSRRLLVSRSVAGGLNWRAPVVAADLGDGGSPLPLVRPDGRLVVVYLTFTPAGPEMRSVFSTNAGRRFRGDVLISSVEQHTPDQMRLFPVPTGEVAGDGRIYVAWNDCSAHPGCVANDLVLARSANGRRWTAPEVVDLSLPDEVDAFLPGLAVHPNGKTRAGTSLALTFYYYADAACLGDGCELYAARTSSRNGGRRWKPVRDISLSPMSPSWLADTSQGRMLGDYLSTSFVGARKAVTVLPLANEPAGGVFDEAMYAYSWKTPPRP